MDRRFDEVIASRTRLRELISEPGRLTSHKSIDHLDPVCRRFIAASPFVLVAPRGGDGRLDISPKGDPAGLVRVLDDKTLVIPDRPGNHRLDTFENLLVHPQVGLFFLIPGNGDTLRVSGTGAIVRDASLQARMAVNAKVPLLLLAVSVEEAFMHCPKCMRRSNLWQPERWPDRSDVPSLAGAMVAHSRLAETVPEMQEIIDRDGDKRLY
jgi:PPOX class probable FMN-dependent enzyme